MRRNRDPSEHPTVTMTTVTMTTVTMEEVTSLPVPIVIAAVEVLVEGLGTSHLADNPQYMW